MPPPPKKGAIRRNLKSDWETLPEDGCKKPAPPWPSSVAGGTVKVKALWAELWATPQAEQWHKLGWVRVIARYAVLVILSESKDSTASLLGEVRQLEDRLGLTPMAMRRLQWEVGTVTAQPQAGDGRDGGVDPPNVHDIFGASRGTG